MHSKQSINHMYACKFVCICVMHVHVNVHVSLYVYVWEQREECTPMHHYNPQHRQQVISNKTQTRSLNTVELIPRGAPSPVP